MSTVATPAKLLRQLAALPYAELDKLVPRILTLRVQKHPAVLSRAESRLLKKISAAPPAKLVREYDRLIAKRELKGLVPAEQKQLERLVAEFDAYHLRHVCGLTELAAIRQTSVAAVVRSLGLGKTANGAVAARSCAGR